MPVGAGSSNQVIQLVVTTSKCTHILKSLAVSRVPPTPSFISPSQSTLLYSSSLCHQHLFFPGSLCCLHQAQFHPSHPECSWRQSPSTGLGGDSEPFDPTLRNGLQSCSHHAEGRNHCKNQGNKSMGSFSPQWETDGCSLFLLIHRIISSGKKRAAASPWEWVVIFWLLLWMLMKGSSGKHPLHCCERWGPQSWEGFTQFHLCPVPEAIWFPFRPDLL